MDKFMRTALALARKSNPHPNPRAGAVLVKNGKIIGQGYHKKAGHPHAEIEAMVDAKGKGNRIKGSTLYVTLEPCSHTAKRTAPCTKTIIENGISKVVFGMEDPNPLVNGKERLRKAGIKVVGPVAEQKASAMNRRYLENIVKKPLVVIKMAISADGKTATRTGESKWITSESSRRYVHKMRSRFDAVLVGAETVKKDNPRHTARMKG